MELKLTERMTGLNYYIIIIHIIMKHNVIS